MVTDKRVAAGVFLSATLALLPQAGCRGPEDAFPPSGAGAAMRLVVTNPENVRRSEIIETPIAVNRHVSGVLKGDGVPATFQVLDFDGAKTLLVLAEVPPLAREEYLVAFAPFATPAQGGGPQPPDVCGGRHVPERKDDYAWENDRIAFRIYGPTLGADPKETSGSGIDVWAKRVSHPIIDKWYAHRDYHRDRGEGLDAYSVGETRGCGGTGVFVGGKIYSAGVWKAQRTLATGPLRVVFEVEYAPYQAGGATIAETKRVSLDRGSFFSRFQTTLKIEGADSIPFAAGVARRKDEEAPHSGPGWAAAMEPEAPHGRIGAAVIMKGGKLALPDGHALLVKEVRDGDTIEHLAGACWTKEGSFPDLAAWAEHTKDVAQPRLRALVVSGQLHPPPGRQGRGGQGPLGPRQGGRGQGPGRRG